MKREGEPVERGPSGPWSATARKKEGTYEALVWGHEDPAVPISNEVLDQRMANYLAEIPPSQWREADGAVRYENYQNMHRWRKQDQKQWDNGIIHVFSGLMVMEHNGEGNNLSTKFNIVMDARDPLANIDALEANLNAHIIQCVGSADRILSCHTEKDLQHDHASR